MYTRKIHRQYSGTNFSETTTTRTPEEEKARKRNRRGKVLLGLAAGTAGLGALSAGSHLYVRKKINQHIKSQNPFAQAEKALKREQDTTKRAETAQKKANKRAAKYRGENVRKYNAYGDTGTNTVDTTAVRFSEAGARAIEEEAAKKGRKKRLLRTLATTGLGVAGLVGLEAGALLNKSNKKRVNHFNDTVEKMKKGNYTHTRYEKAPGPTSMRRDKTVRTVNVKSKNMGNTPRSVRAFAHAK